MVTKNKYAHNSDVTQLATYVLFVLFFFFFFFLRGRGWCKGEKFLEQETLEIVIDQIKILQQIFA